MATARWRVWSTSASVVVTEADALAPARELVEAELAAVDAACSRFREDSELARAEREGGPVTVSPLLAELVGAALAAATRSGGDVDPTLGADLARLGYDRDIAEVRDGPAVRTRVGRTTSWRDVGLAGRTLTVPPGTRLDLGATAKALTADRCARLVADRLGTGVLVELGGDIATAGPAPHWRIHVRDRPTDPETTVRVTPGTAMATSSTTSRSWRRGGLLLHHVLDPRTGMPSNRVWRSVTVAADTCVVANTHSTASLVRGADAVGALSRAGVAARLVDRAGRVHVLGGWPS
ncbi:FAD:protein FMN transferase [Actinophytocola oryzae]|uniref:FAD:protein FMN transferase n=1 Tax=Actinophytocola oryzae TaxID=502181 RepID=A0A4R7W4R8_9PSEU|nr:FAD:protein FMN transferase [Actinophytocola oryzae]TDV57205.1 thiamine biosynthesis lipoprotein [Actinophytocola oryzae]